MTPTPTQTTGFDDIDATIASLQALAAWRTAHPEIPGRMITSTIFCVHDHLTDLSHADIVRAIADGAPLGSIEKRPGNANEELLFVRRHFGHDVTVSYSTLRDEVCTRRVVGTETVRVPDPDAPLVEVVREIVEWDCAPILAKAAG